MESVQRHYAAYVTKGGDGNTVLQDRGRTLGYTQEVCATNNGHNKNEDELYAAFCGSGCPLALVDNDMMGQTVLDLGCGAGHDVILASRRVGPTGRVVGVDCTPEMLVAAQGNVDKFHNPATDGAITLVQAAIDDVHHLPAPANTAHVILSNGVINLCRDKEAAFTVAFQMLQPGGRFLLADVCQTTDAPPLGDMVCEFRVNDANTNTSTATVSDVWSA